jgi:hydrogenase nickel incorporation protein HypA/HybF
MNSADRHRRPQVKALLDDLRRPRYTRRVHEMSIAVEIHRSCREAVEEHHGLCIERVLLAVGELSAVEPDLLRFAWEAVVADGPDAGAVLDVEWCPAVQFCTECDTHKERGEGRWLPTCPDCGQQLQVDGGTELDILELTFTTDGEGS